MRTLRYSTALLEPYSGGGPCGPHWTKAVHTILIAMRACELNIETGRDHRRDPRGSNEHIANLSILPPDFGVGVTEKTNRDDRLVVSLLTAEI